MKSSSCRIVQSQKGIGLGSIVFTKNSRHNTESINMLNSVPMDVAVRMLAGARLVIGNNSGMPIIADYLKVPAIQLFRRGEKVTPQIAGLSHGIDLIEPTVDEVYTRVQTILG